MHQRIVGLLAKCLGMSPCGRLLPRRWSGVMFTPACHHLPHSWSLCRYTTTAHLGRLSWLASWAWDTKTARLGSTPLPPAALHLLHHRTLLRFCFFTFLSHSARWVSTKIASGVYLYVWNITEMSQHWWWSIRYLMMPLMPPWALPAALWTAVCSFTPLQR